MLLLHGAGRINPNAADHAGMTALMWAAYHNRPGHITKLIQAGADPQEKDVDGKTPMHWVG